MPFARRPYWLAEHRGKRAVQIRAKRRRRSRGSHGQRSHHQVCSVWQRIEAGTHEVTEPTAYAISYHSATDSLGHDKTGTRR
jgi:hypothetical protein